MTPAPTDPFELGSQFAPGPVGWRIARMTAPNGHGAVMLVFETTTGKTGVLLDNDSALRLSDQLREHAGGLAIARSEVTPAAATLLEAVRKNGHG